MFVCAAAVVVVVVVFEFSKVASLVVWLKVWWFGGEIVV